MGTISAVKIQSLWYCDIAKITADLTGTALYALLKGTDVKSITNIHQDTWKITEADPTVTGYKNELTGEYYRVDKEAGDIDMEFTIGAYDYPTKADLLGGTATATTWKRATGVQIIYKAMIALTQDGQYCVFPKAHVIGVEADTDKATGLSVKAVQFQPDTADVQPEYWFDSTEVKAAA
jgi:hypothetical protein